MAEFRTPTPHQVLKDNQLRREGRGPVRDLDIGYTALRIPEKTCVVDGSVVPGFRDLVNLFPELASDDHEIRKAAWKNLEAGELGDLYRVTQRSPRQVQRSTKYGSLGIIVK